ncbi:MAG: recombinase family protein [Candidatus Nanoarchaeia archaeon]|nr:recombinase family protein [Candidatus Nanoarchaeia archaeon]
MHELEGLKAISLLRVSSKKQGTKLNNNDNNEIDIPEQRKIINDFMEKNKITLFREFIEGGVSAFKLKPDERDALRTIKAMALNKQFNILIVYASDRIGRIADESPAVIRFLNDLGIRVWSYTEGEIKTNTHIDKLITYIQFWRNEEDSLKISKRSTDYHIQMIKDGKFRGGIEAPYGYKLIDNGRLNHKGRKVLDLEIDENEFQIAKLIYDLSIDYNMGK